MTQRKVTESRADAIKLGLKYYKGKPCKRYGHSGVRFVSDKGCIECRVIWRQQWQQQNRDKAREYCRKWRNNNPEENKAAQRRHYWKNRDKRRANTHKWAIKNREHRREYQRRTYQENPAPTIARITKREADKIQRTPKWADLEAIKFFYECRPAGCHVDHIIPLRGKNVCGLHVAENLQWLPDKLNCSKGNRYEI